MLLGKFSLEVSGIWSPNPSFLLLLLHHRAMSHIPAVRAVPICKNITPVSIDSHRPSQASGSRGVPVPTRPSIKSSVYQPTQARDHSHNESRPTITSPASIMRRRIRHDPAPRQAEKAQRPGQRKRYRQEDDGKDHAPQVLGRNGAVVEVPVGRGSQLGRGQVGHGFSLCPLSSLFEVVVWRGEKLACWLFGLISLSVVLVGTQVGRIRLYCVWRTASKEENSSVSAGIGRALTQHAREKMGEAKDTNWLRVRGVNSWLGGLVGCGWC